MKDIQFKLLDFRVFDEEMVEDETDSDSSEHTSVKTKQFRVQVFGLDEKGRTYSLILTDFEPFFYIKVDHTWTRNTKNGFERHIKKLVGKYHADNITKIQLVERETLYGFDNGQKYKFMCIKFTNTTTMNKVKNLFYYNPKVTHSDGTETSERKLIPDGLPYRDSTLELYEANIPPLLRLFHIRKISPSGWVSVSKRSLKPSSYKRTTSNFEYTIPYSKLSPLPEKEDPVPYKICSFDIEASSSHGDFPVPIKNYKKLAGNIIDYWGQYNDVLDDESDEIKKEHIIALVESAFGYGHSDDVDLVYPKRKPKDIKDVRRLANLIVNKTLKDAYKASTSDFSEQLDNQYNIEDMFLGSGDVDNTDTTKEATGVDDERPSYMAAKERADFRRIKQRKAKMKKEAKHGILYFLDSKDHDREEKMDAVTKILDSTLPPLKGDMVTFIGSTFLKYGDADPYLNHCITLNTCTDVDGAEIERYNNEADVLLAWTKLIQRENPDIIIGYNIFGFDYSFMFYRAKENGPECVKEFLKLSRNKDEVCWNKSYKTNEYDIERSSITIASGTHNLHFVKMAGRIQVDLYNYFRREYNLSSYKLDYASGHFIGDKVKTLEQNPASNITVVKSKNLTGLKKGAYVNFEEIGHSTEYYEDGKKFNVTDVDLNTGEFVVEGVVTPDMKKTIRWCLAKDDVTPQDIFRFTNQGPNERAIVAKYCIQDCNLVHHLLRKIDVVTGIVEMAKICSVPIDFIIMRGQGIKLFSFIAKKCREAGVLIPVLERKNDGSYEGAIVLPPKTGLYLNEPVACVDYSSLYPSSMISENLSHDSKVWTREYNLKGELIEENGVKNENGEFVYDNLEGFKYVDVTYDTYKYLRLNPRGAEVKTKVGYKTCRFAQFPDGNLAIMPRILKELLAARKATRTSAKWKTVKTSIGDYTGLVIEKTDDHVTLKDKDGNVKVIETESIISMGDTYDDFMKNVLDKRQLAIKVTANSLYGQCGARTSSFYEKDVAASTTATGRKLLTYGKRIIEDVYGDRICETKYGKVHSHAEYVYGDSVTGDTPIILRHKTTCNILTKRIMDLSNEWTQYDEFKPYDSYTSNRREKQQSVNEEYDVWTKNGWHSINRVIRHKCNKKIYRVVTHNSVVDVTEDHSLLDMNGDKIKPGDCQIGTALLENTLSCSVDKVQLTFDKVNNFIHTDMTKQEQQAFIYGFFMGDGSCGKYETKGNTKYSWALNNANYPVCERLVYFLENIYDKRFKILDTISSSGVYKIVPSCGNIKSFVEEYSCLYDGKCKVIPSEILNNNACIKTAFLCGYYLADGDKCSNNKCKVLRFDCKNKLTASYLQIMAYSLGFNVSMNARNDKDIYRITCTTNTLRKQTNCIKKLYVKHEIYDDFVYDIETSDGTFNTGFPLIIKNTDSVFMSFKLTRPNSTEKIVGKEALKHTIELAKEAGELATKFLKGPHDLEYEKTFMPFCLLSKKRYVGMLYEEDPEKCYRKSMGIVLKRRDNAPIVKDVYGGIIDILMKDQDIGKAVSFTKDCLQNIVDEKYPLEKLVITKSLRSFYKNPQQIAHKVLADRMGKRDPGNKPSSGDRIPFVYIQTKGKHVLQGDKIEHPEYIKKNNIRPDYTFYITNQIMKPVQQLFGLVLEDIPGFEKKRRTFLRKERCKLRAVEEKGGDALKMRTEREKLRNKEIKELIFDDALRKGVNDKNGQHAITSFFGFS